MTQPKERPVYDKGVKRQLHELALTKDDWERFVEEKGYPPTARPHHNHRTAAQIAEGFIPERPPTKKARKSG